ncbi:hypothetical protein [Clostridium frigidicarnis]|uniref:Uncharacterized protein n=1 Tax=Clostridium frigidicarnis TaxID=84698 RepID=A0A1I0V1A0_9CLOT|nr:hypothetical protein [Clostridium frigidicarnis]SFA70085.1 hypothetical protein SAMN04488528_100185 [Clostridium frigidicarnis]
MADIYFSTLDRSIVLQLPQLPKDFPKLDNSARNEEFETFNNGFYNFQGNISLTTFSLEGSLPGDYGKYHWQRGNNHAIELKNLWRSSMFYKIPLRCLMIRGETGNPDVDEYYNGIITIESLSWQLNQQLDYVYSITCKEYKPIDTNNLGVW